MRSMRPSMRGWLSTTAMSLMISVILFSIFQPSSVCAISRPLKRTVPFALLPSPRKRRTCLALKSKSCVSVFGPSLTSLTTMVVCFFRASFCRRACVYLYLPKSMIRHTGGGGPGGPPPRGNSGRLGGHFDEVHVALLRQIQRLRDGEDPQLLAVGAHHPHFPDANAFVDPNVLGLYRRDSLLCGAPADRPTVRGAGRLPSSPAASAP